MRINIEVPVATKPMEYLASYFSVPGQISFKKLRNFLAGETFSKVHMNVYKVYNTKLKGNVAVIEMIDHDNKKSKQNDSFTLDVKLVVESIMVTFSIFQVRGIHFVSSTVHSIYELNKRNNDNYSLSTRIPKEELRLEAKEQTFG
jgi:hypothetical protein